MIKQAMIQLIIEITIDDLVLMPFNMEAASSYQIIASLFPEEMR